MANRATTTPPASALRHGRGNAVNLQLAFYGRMGFEFLSAEECAITLHAAEECSLVCSAATPA